MTPNIQIGTVTQGTSFNVTRTGTNENPVLNFTLVKGDKGDRGIQGIQGLTGNGISSITKTGTDGLVDTYTITYTNGNTTTFTITNGEDGEVTETELNVLRQKLENQQKVIDQLPQVEGQGTEVTLENTIEAQFTKFDVEGNSTQETTEGRQLLPKPTKINSQIVDTSTKNGITLTPIVGGKFHIKGTAKAKADFFLFREEQLIVEKGDYTISSNNLPSGVLVVTSGGGNNGFVYTELSSSNPKVTSSVTDDTKPFSYVVIRIARGTTVDADIYVQLEKGTTATDWEKYTGGIASPNPNYEQPIKSAGDNENLLPYPYIAETKTMNGVTFKVNKDGTVIANGTATANAYFMLKGDIDLNGTYTISTGLGISNRKYMALLDQNAGYADKMTTRINNATATVNSRFQAYIYVISGTTVDNLVFKPKIEKGNKVSGYSPYGMGSINEKIKNADGTEEQDYSIFVQQPFRSIGDVRDGFAKVNGVWNEKHIPYIESYNGEALPQDVYNEVDGIKYCNEKSMSTTGQFSIGASVQYIDENNWNDLPCTETQIQQLENLPSTYKDFTIIQSEDDTPAYLEVSGIYDLNKLINN